MCTLFIAVNQHTDYQIILIENRDEFYKRKSIAAHWWQNPEILAGKDLEKQGTWLGINKQGDFAVVTNYRDFKLPMFGEKSRGDLVPFTLSPENDSQNIIAFLQERSTNSAPFNFLFSKDNQVYYFSSVKQELQLLADGIYGLSNAYLDTPWFKITTGKQHFTQIINRPILEKEALFKLMHTEQKAADDQLPKTGLPYDKEKLVSSLFIKSADYGTICTTLFTKSAKNKIYFEERRVDGEVSKIDF